MKQFDVNLAKSGHPVCTNIGEPVVIIKYDYHGEHPIIAIVDKGERQVARLYDLDGKHKYRDDFLMMAPVKREGWVNVYNVNNDGKDKKTGHNIYATKEEAEENGGKFRIAIAKIEWEE